MTKAARLRKIRAAYAMVEQACSIWARPDLPWLSAESAILRGAVARDLRRFYRTGSY